MELAFSCLLFPVFILFPFFHNFRQNISTALYDRTLIRCIQADNNKLYKSYPGKEVYVFDMEYIMDKAISIVHDIVIVFFAVSIDAQT